MRNILFLISVLIATGCTTDPTEADTHVYSCVVLYRCVGATELTARLTLPCAVDEEEAESYAQDVGLNSANDVCADGWMNVQARCELEDHVAKTCDY